MSDKLTRGTQLWQRLLRRLHGSDHKRADGSCKAPPEWLVLVVNNFCNLHCRMCDVGIKETSSVFYTHMIGSDPRNMELALLEQLLEQAQAFDPKPKIGLAFTEPLLHPHILEFCRAIVGRGFFCSITTNGYLLPKLAEELVRIGVHEITISIDGPAEIHDQVRGKAGSFARLYQGVKLLNSAKAALGHARPVVRFSYTITDQNYTAMLPFVREVEALQPASLNFSHLNFISDEMASAHNSLYGGELAMARSNLGSMELERIDLDALLRALQELKAYARSQPSLAALKVVPDLEEPQELELFYRQPLKLIGGRQCTDPWKLLMIRSDGTAIPAHSRCYNIAIGNVRERSLTQLWNDQRLRDFRRTLRQAGGSLPACTRCCGLIGKAKA